MQAPGEPNVFGSERAVNASCVDDRVQVRWKRPLCSVSLKRCENTLAINYHVPAALLYTLHAAAPLPSLPTHTVLTLSSRRKDECQMEQPASLSAAPAASNLTPRELSVRAHVESVRRQGVLLLVRLLREHFTRLHQDLHNLCLHKTPLRV